MRRSPLRATLLAALLALVAQTAASGPSSMSSSPDELAQISLGNLRGSAVAAMLSKGETRYGAARSKDIDAPTIAPEKQLYEIGSISKVFTGLLLAQEVEAGRMSLDDTLAKLLGRRVKLAPHVGNITLRQLVTHSSCLPRMPDDFKPVSDNNLADGTRYYAKEDRSMIWATLGSVRLKQASPCVGSYSNYGFAVLGELLAQRHGKSWETLVRERITQPLGMRDTFQHLNASRPALTPGFFGNDPAPPWEFRAFAGAGGLRSTPADILTFSRALMAGRTGPLGAAAHRAMQPLGTLDRDQIGYGIMMRGPREHRYFWHNGGTFGYRAYWAIMPDTQQAFAILAGNGQADVDRPARDLLLTYYPAPATRIDIDAATLPQYAGVFRINEHAACILVAQGGRLYQRLTGQSYSPLLASGSDSFVLPEYGSEFRFTRRDGKVAEVALHQRGVQAFRAPLTAAEAPKVAIPDGVNQMAYGGRYTAASPAPLELQVSVSENQIFVQNKGERKRPAFPVDGKPDRFAWDGNQGEFQFERDENQQIKSLLFHQNGTATQALRQ